MSRHSSLACVDVVKVMSLLTFLLILCFLLVCFIAQNLLLSKNHFANNLYISSTYLD